MCLLIGIFYTMETIIQLKFVLVEYFTCGYLILGLV